MGDQDFADFIELIDFVDSIHPPELQRPRILRDRANHFRDYDDADFFRRFRISKEVALSLLNKINDSLEFNSDRNGSITPMQQLLIALRFYATGSHLLAIGDFNGVSVSTVSRIVKRVSLAITQLRHRYISSKFPRSEEDIERNQRDFFDIAGFPYVIGTVDCTHIKLQSPGGVDAEIFRNRKGYFSLNVQTVSDAHLKILNLVVRWPGSSHDASIFTNSQLYRDFESGAFGRACLLGDSGYPLKDYLLTPYLQPSTSAQSRYNDSHIRTRNTVERQYGVLKRRFPALAVGLRIKLETAVHVIIACCILHNMCIDFGDDIPPNESDNIDSLIENGQIDHIYTRPPYISDRREMLTNTFFSSYVNN